MTEAARLSVVVEAKGVRETAAAVGGVQRSLAGAAKTALKFTAAYAGIRAAGDAFKFVTDQTVQFDRSMRNVNSIARLSETKFKALEQSVLKLAGPTAQAPKSLADGMYQLESSGFNASQSLKILKSTAVAATAGLTDTGTATTAVAGVLNAYHLSADKAQQVSDTLFQTVNRGVVTFQQLATTIGTVLPFASSLGIPLRDVGAAISTLTKEGIPAENATTFLKNAMVSFLKPSKELTAAIKATGAASGEGLIKSKGFEGALLAVAKQTDGTKAGLHALFPDIRASSAVFDLVGKSAKMAKGDIAGFSNISGISLRVFKEQSKSVGVQWDRLKAIFQVAAIRIGSALIPAVSSAVKWVSKFVAQMEAGKGAGGRFADKVSSIAHAVGSVLGPIVKVGGAIAKFFYDQPKFIAVAIAAWATYRAAIAGSMAVSGAAAGAAFGARTMGAIRGLGWAALGAFIGFEIGKSIGNSIKAPVHDAFSAVFDFAKSKDLQAQGDVTKPIGGLTSGGQSKQALSSVTSVLNRIDQIPATKRIAILAENKQALSAVGVAITGLVKYGKTKALSRILANNDDAKSKLAAIQALSAKLGNYLWAHPAKARADTSQATSALHQLQAMINSLHGKTVRVTTVNTTISDRQAQGGGVPKTAPHPPKAKAGSYDPTATTSAVKHQSTGYNALTDKIEHHTAAEWSVIRAKIAKSNAAKRRLAKYRQNYATPGELAISAADIQVADAGLTKGTKDDLKANQGRLVALRRRAVELKRKLAKGHLTKRQRVDARSEYAGILGDIGSEQATIHDLKPKGATAMGMAQAGLAVNQAIGTPENVIGSLTTIKGLWQDELQAAMKSGNAKKIAAAADGLKQASDQLKQAADDQKAAAEAARDTVATGDSAKLVMAQVDTPNSTTDDLSVLNQTLTDDRGFYTDAVNRGDSEGIIKWGNAILGVLDAIKGLNESQDQSLADQLDLWKGIAQSAQRDANIANAQFPEFARWISGVVMGHGGQGVLRASTTPAAGRVGSL